MRNGTSSRSWKRRSRKTIKENIADVAIVAQQVEKVEKLRAENNATRTVMIYRMHLLLTPEQRVKVDAMRARMDAERKSRSKGAATSAEATRWTAPDPPALVTAISTVARFIWRQFVSKTASSLLVTAALTLAVAAPAGAQQQQAAPETDHVKALIEQAMVRLNRRRPAATQSAGRDRGQGRPDRRRSRGARARAQPDAGVAAPDAADVRLLPCRRRARSTVRT